MRALEVRGPDRVDDLVAVVRSVEGLADVSADELLLSCHERGGTVLAADGVGAVAMALGRSDAGDLVASIRLLVVDPGLEDEAARLVRDSLMAAAEEWATDRSASRLVLGGGVPFALVPGVPHDSIDVEVAVARGFSVDDGWWSHLVPVTHRADPPTGVVVRRAVRDEDVASVLVLASARWPRRSDEIARALDHGTCHVALELRDGADEVVGIATHSIARAGWTGPIVVVDDARRRGIGRALLGQVCRDLMIAEFPHVVVGDAVTPEAQALLASVGAQPDRRWVTVDRPLGSPN